MSQQWFSAYQLARLGAEKVIDIPRSERRAGEKALKLKWMSRSVPGAGGKGGMRTEYQPPADVLALIQSFLAANPEFFAKSGTRTRTSPEKPKSLPDGLARDDKNWFSATELSMLGKLNVAKLPTSAVGSTGRAQRDAWISREVPCMGGKKGIRTEYQPPTDVLALINAFLADNPGFFKKKGGDAPLSKSVKEVAQVTRKRKIIQIQALRFGKNLPDGRGESLDTELIALCDDGSVWTKATADRDSEWCRVQDIPQDGSAT